MGVIFGAERKDSPRASSHWFQEFVNIRVHNSLPAYTLNVEPRLRQLNVGHGETDGIICSVWCYEEFGRLHRSG